MDNFAIGSAHRFEHPTLSGRTHFVRDLGRETSECFPAMLSVTADIDVQPALALTAIRLRHQTSQLLHRLQRLPTGPDQWSEFGSLQTDLDVAAFTINDLGGAVISEGRRQTGQERCG